MITSPGKPPPSPPRRDHRHRRDMAQAYPRRAGPYPAAGMGEARLWPEKPMRGAGAKRSEYRKFDPELLAPQLDQVVEARTSYGH